MLFLWQRRCAVCGGVALASDLSDLSDLSDMMGAPVFALTGYAVASLGITRGFAVPLCGMGLGADLPMGCAGLFL